MESRKSRFKRRDQLTFHGRFDGNAAPERGRDWRAWLDDGVWSRDDIYLAALSDHVRHVCELVGLLPVMKVYEDSTAAEGNFSRA